MAFAAPGITHSSIGRKTRVTHGLVAFEREEQAAFVEVLGQATPPDFVQRRRFELGKVCRGLVVNAHLGRFISRLECAKSHGSYSSILVFIVSRNTRRPCFAVKHYPQTCRRVVTNPPCHESRRSRGD